MAQISQQHHIQIHLGIFLVESFPIQGKCHDCMVCRNFVQWFPNMFQDDTMLVLYFLHPYIDVLLVTELPEMNLGSSGLLDKVHFLLGYKSGLDHKKSLDSKAVG